MTLFRPIAILQSVLLSLAVCTSTAASISSDTLNTSTEDRTLQDSVTVNILNEKAFANHLTIPDQSLVWAYDALALAKEIGYVKGEAQAMRQIGVVCWTQANYALALKYFIEGLKLAEQLNDQQIIADITGNMGLVYHALGDEREALQYHERALALQKILNNTTRISVTLNNLGDVYRATKDYEKAIACYREAYRLRKETGHAPGMATNIRNIGNVFEAQGQLKEALREYMESMRMSDSLSDKRGMSQCRYSIASVYFKLHDYTQAKRFANNSLSIAAEANFRSFMRDNYLLLSQIDEAMGSLSSSLNNFRKFTSYKDSVLNLQVASEISSYRLDYETEKQRVQIDLLKKEKEIQDAELAKKNSQLILSAIILAMVIALGVILWRSFKKQKTLNQQLHQKNSEIEDQNHEISAQRDELIALNEEIRAQQDDLVASRDSLAEKNVSIARMNEEIITINQNLEKLIRERTFALEKQNQQLIQYAFINAHKLRAPVARILGLANLVSTINADEREKILGLLRESAHELDDVTRSITEIVQNGIEAYQKV